MFDLRCLCSGPATIFGRASRQEESRRGSRGKGEKLPEVHIFFSFVDPILFCPHFFLILSFPAQVSVKGRARSRGSETARAADRGEEEDDRRGEEEEKDVPGHGTKNDGCVSVSGWFSCKQSAFCYTIDRHTEVC